jgi:hypothetical protein
LAAWDSTSCSTITSATLLRGAVGAASGGANASVSMSDISAALYPPAFDHAWRAVTCIENHDLVLAGRDPRLPALADRPITAPGTREAAAASRPRFS